MGAVFIAEEAREFALRALRQIEALQKRVAELEKPRQTAIRKCPDECGCQSCKADSQFIPRPDLSISQNLFLSDRIDILRGKRPNSCWGCHDDDRGFVIVVGCPVHFNKVNKDGQAVKADDVAGD